MNDKLLKIAAETLNVSQDIVKKHFKEIPEHDAYYFWNPAKGGLAVIIGKTGEKLGASSGIDFKKHLKAFVEGKRN